MRQYARVRRRDGAYQRGIYRDVEAAFEHERVRDRGVVLGVGVVLNVEVVQVANFGCKRP